LNGVIRRFKYMWHKGTDHALQIENETSAMI